jgi:hypothetical protein
VRFAERLVGRDGHAGCLLALGQDQEQQLDAEQVGAAVVADGLGELPVVSGLG